jgi:DNA ligase (NAD+)
MDIESLGEQNVRALVEAGLVESYVDLYTLTYEKLNGLTIDISSDGKKRSFQKRSAERLLEAIEESKKVPFERVLFAIGIRYVGDTTARKIARYFTSMDSLMKATREELLMVDEVGEKIADSIMSYFADERHIDEIDRLKTHGVQLEIKSGVMSVKSDVLGGKSYVVSGKFSISRDELKELIAGNDVTLGMLCNLCSRINKVYGKLMTSCWDAFVENSNLESEPGKFIIRQMLIVKDFTDAIG